MPELSTPLTPTSQQAQPVIVGNQVIHDDHHDEEEKLLAGHHDVNMPALLTRDVKGG